MESSAVAIAQSLKFGAQEPHCNITGSSTGQENTIIKTPVANA